MPSMTKRQLAIQDKLLKLAGDFDTLEQALQDARSQYPEGPTIEELVKIIVTVKSQRAGPTPSPAG